MPAIPLVSGVRLPLRQLSDTTQTVQAQNGQAGCEDEDGRTQSSRWHLRKLHTVAGTGASSNILGLPPTPVT